MKKATLISDIKPEEIEKAEKREDLDVGNKILYNMCKEYPKHTDEEEIIGKIWLIGRAYAAAIERCPVEIIYPRDVGPPIKAIGERLDEKLADITQHCQTDGEYLFKMLRTHKFFTNILHDITKMSKRSLASKYLHFHAPNHFYIYDSGVVQKISAYDLPWKELKSVLSEKLRETEYDEAYLDYVAKAHTLNEQLAKQNKGKWLSPRTLDTLLSEVIQSKSTSSEA